MTSLPRDLPAKQRGVGRRLSIGQKLPLLTSGLVLLVALTISAAAYQEVRNTALVTGADRLRGAAIQFAQSVRGNRTTLINALRSTGHKPEILSYLAAPTAAARDAALRALASDPQPPQVFALELRDAQGSVLLTNLVDTSRRTIATSSLSFPRPTRPDSGLVGTFTEVQATIVYPAVVMVPGPVPGYVVSWRQLAANPAGVRLVNQLLGDQGKLYLANADGDFWFDLAGARAPALFEAAQVKSPIVRDRAGAHGELIAAAAPAEIMPWIIGVELPRAAVLAPVDGFVRRMAVVVALCIGAGLIGALMLSRHFTKPLIELTDATAALAMGDYSRRVELKREDELGRLAQTFGTMAAEVEQSRLRLEEKVAERTRDLNGALQQLRAAQETLVRKERLAVLGQLAGSIGHELRNPLGVMSNAVYYLDAVLAASPDDVKRYLDILRRQVALSAKIVDDLMDSTRMKSPDGKTVPLAAIVDSQLERFAQVDGIRIEREIPSDLPPVHVDPVQVGQVVFNLVTNAVQAVKETGGTVKLRGRRHSASLVCLEVSDTGPGITPEHLDRIFEPLFTTRVNGIGLGLAVSKSFTEANNGSLTVSSTVGRGATFELTFPAAPEVRV
ncbi:MAG: ATP-binding protein [Gemmatimonadota bacterium]